MDCREIDKISKKFDAVVCGFCIPFLSPNYCQKFLADVSSLFLKNGTFYLSFLEGDASKS